MKYIPWRPCHKWPVSHHATSGNAPSRSVPVPHVEPSHWRHLEPPASHCPSHWYTRGLHHHNIHTANILKANIFIISWYNGPKPFCFATIFKHFIPPSPEGTSGYRSITCNLLKWKVCAILWSLKMLYSLVILKMLTKPDMNFNNILLKGIIAQYISCILLDLNNSPNSFPAASFSSHFNIPFIVYALSVYSSTIYQWKYSLKRNRQDDCQYVYDEVLYISSGAHQLSRAVMHG